MIADVDLVVEELETTCNNPQFECNNSELMSKYFNNAGLSLPFNKVTSVTKKYRDLFETISPFHPYLLVTTNNLLDSCRVSLANLIEAKKDEIALTQNATEAIQGILLSLDLNSRDVILMGKREHPSMYLLKRNLEKKGALVIYVDTIQSPYEQNIPESVVFAAFSVITYISGKKLHEDWLKYLKQNDIPWLADATQAVGLIDLSIKHLGCSFLVGSGHKWLHGPIGTGFVYIEEKSREMLFYYPRAWKSVEYSYGKIVDRKNATRFEQATQDLSPFAGLTVAARWAASEHWSIIRKQRSTLSNLFQNSLNTSEEIEIINDCSGILGLEASIGIFNAHEIYKKCFKHNDWVIKAIDPAEFPGSVLRISFSINNNKNDTLELATYLNDILY